MEGDEGLGELLDLSMGAWKCAVLKSAMELDLFTKLSKIPKTKGAKLINLLGFTIRVPLDFLDALVGLNLLSREGIGEDSLYSNSPSVEKFLNEDRPETNIKC